MPKIQIPKKLRTEDFPSDQQDLIGGIADVYNNFTDEVYRTLNGGVDFTNLSQKLVTVVIVTNSAGELVNPPQIKLDLPVRVSGVIVVRATNLVNSTVYPTSAPFVSTTQTTQLLSIVNVTGLQAGSQYQLTLLLL